MGTASLALSLFQGVEGLRLRAGFARQDPAGIESALRRLGWFGFDSSENRIQLGRLLEARGDEGGALAQYRRSTALYATPRGWGRAASLHEQRGETDQALAAWEAMAELAPERSEPHYRAGRLWLERGDLPRALAALEEAVRLDPGRASYRETLSRARALSAERASSAPEPEASG
jgi:tetratricopeptide (TPR) repeat protein